MSITIVRLIGVALAALMANAVNAADLRIVSGLAHPESVAMGADGRVYVSEMGEVGKDGDGRISAIDNKGRIQSFAMGFDDPKGLVRWKRGFFISDKTRVWKVDGEGRATVFASPIDFPEPPHSLNDIAVDSRGNLYIADSGDVSSSGKGAIFKITPHGNISLVINEAKNPLIKNPSGLLFERPGKLLIIDFTSGELYRLDVVRLTLDKIADGLIGGDGLARDSFGILYISDSKSGRVWKLDLKKKNAKPEQYAQIFQAAADIALSKNRKYILVPDMKAGTLTWLPK